MSEEFYNPHISPNDFKEYKLLRHNDEKIFEIETLSQQETLYTNRMGNGGKWKVFLPIKSAASCEVPLVCLFILSCFAQIA